MKDRLKAAAVIATVLGAFIVWVWCIVTVICDKGCP